MFWTQKKTLTTEKNALPDMTEEQLAQVAGGKTFNLYQYYKSHKKQWRRLDETYDRGFTPKHHYNH